MTMPENTERCGSRRCSEGWRCTGQDAEGEPTYEPCPDCTRHEGGDAVAKQDQEVQRSADVTEPASEQSGAGSTCPTRYEQLLAQETLIFDATEEICRVMSPDQDSSEVTRKQLADRLGKSKGFVTQVLAGDRNMTLRTLADFAGALGHKVSVHLEPIPGPPDEKPSTQHNLPEQGADASSEPESCAEPECDGSGRIPSGECKVAMSGPTCFDSKCPPCQYPETTTCPGCSACMESNRIAICTHPNGEGVWWGLKPDEDGSKCIQECDCTPRVYVLESEHEEITDSLQAESNDNFEALEAAEARLREAGQERDAALSDRLHLARDLKAAREALENIRGEAHLWQIDSSPHDDAEAVIEALRRLAAAAIRGDRS